MNWDQGDYADGPDPSFHHIHHASLVLPFAVLLIVALVALAMLFLPALLRMRDEALQARVRDRIYRKVREALDAALSGPTGAAQIAGAQKLVNVYDQQLNALTKLSTGLGAPMETLRKVSLPSKVKDPPKKDPHDLDLVLSLDRGVLTLEPELAQAAAEAPKEIERDISAKEQIEAVRAALEAFADVWSKPQVHNLLLNLQRALLDASPPQPEESKADAKATARPWSRAKA